MIEKDKMSEEKLKNLEFLKEVTKYFMDFLETNFQKRRIPKRSIRFRNKDNLLIGINLNKYDSFSNLIRKLINSSFNKKLWPTVVKGKYLTTVPRKYLGIIKLIIDDKVNKNFDFILDEIKNEIVKAKELSIEDAELVLELINDKIFKILRRNVVVPIISGIESSARNLSLGDDNNIYLMEEDLSAILNNYFAEKVLSIIKNISENDNKSVKEMLLETVAINEIKSEIISFFETFKLTDLYNELFEMIRNKNILDKQEFYLYFYDITFNKIKFPIFYIPFYIEKQSNGLCVNFNSQLFINKKALEYIVQEYNKAFGKKGTLKTISERIIYLAQYENKVDSIIKNIMDEIVDYFNLDRNIEISDYSKQVSKGYFTSITNSCYIALFDKSDEALINDYEEILQNLNDKESPITQYFNNLINEFINKNPKTFNDDIEDDWSTISIKDKLVYRSPVPLNSEQIKILSAIKKDECKYITVEGPPGTGKSHTITAIVFDAILENKTVLVLSDKKEALDVVEDKIKETMNKVRHDKKIKNPILRLGKTGNTYKQLLSTSSIENIRKYYSAARSKYKSIMDDINKIERTLKEEIESEVLSYNDINFKDIKDVFLFEEYFNKNYRDYFDFNEIYDNLDSYKDILELRQSLLDILKIKDYLEKESLQFIMDLGIKKGSIDSYDELLKIINNLKLSQDIKNKVMEVFNDKINNMIYFPELSIDDLDKLKDIYNNCIKIRTPILGYLFKKKQVDNLSLKFRKSFPFSKIKCPHKKLSVIGEIIEIIQYIKELSFLHRNINIDFVKIVHYMILNNNLESTINNIYSLKNNIEKIMKLFEKYPNTFKMLSINVENLSTINNSILFNINEMKMNAIIHFLKTKQSLENKFKNIINVNYLKYKTSLERNVAFQMTYIMDGRLINFYNNYKNDSRTIREIIIKKKKFPKNEFVKLKEAFPCILAGIRDYAEYIPLEPEIFDLVIIDEASQVSIAQAFPAFLRGKKILILGDKKQFSNVKSAHARKDINKEYLNNLENVFKKTISNDEAKIIKLKKFDIKTSVLDFFEFINNYSARLLKHFRGYKELISYSNKYFYNDDLEVMKIRAKPITDVIKFSILKQDGKFEIYPNTNVFEVNFIINELEKMKKKGRKDSVCVITPHTNQQKLFVEKVNEHPDKDYFFDDLKLKIFTFDTCQGEERDIVFYSMVANENSDKLWAVFIKDIYQNKDYLDEKIKIQRLNVGFSRAKEMMHFVLSKPIEKYTGSIGEAIRHYYMVLKKAEEEPMPDEVDSNSPMERKVLSWIKQTLLWKKYYPERVFLKPQFKLGEYLRQLDKNYNHPEYVVDFLLIYKDNTNQEHKIIIEYDGFKEHFKKYNGINEFNYEKYYSENDIYRQKVLESYGYKFLRINKFNIGKNPIKTLDARLNNIINNKNRYEFGNLDDVYILMNKLEEKKVKECPKCKNIRPIDDFYDPSLLTEYGRICKFCKENMKRTNKEKLSYVTIEI